MSVVFVWYLWLCLGIFIALHIWGYFEDLVRGPDPKFGYNIQFGKFTFFNALACAFSCPIVNLVLLVAFFWVRIPRRPKTNLPTVSASKNHKDDPSGPSL